MPTQCDNDQVFPYEWNLSVEGEISCQKSTGLTKSELAAMITSTPDVCDNAVNEILVKSRREKVIVAAMQGILSNSVAIELIRLNHPKDEKKLLEIVTKQAIEFADALIAKM